MNAPATVDVIVPSLRRPDALKRALASVEAVRAATADWADIRVQVVDESEGSADGPSAARNRAVAKGTADYIALLDDDDLWEPHRLDAAVGILQTRDDIGIVSGDAKLASGGLFLGAERKRGDHHHRDLTLDSFVCTSTVTMRRADWDAAGGMDESLRLAEDYDLYLRVTRYGMRIHVLDDVIATYTDTGEGIGRDCGLMAAATLEVLAKSAFPGFTKDEPNWARRLGVLNGAAAHWVMRERGDFSEGRRLALLAIGGAPRDKIAWTALVRSVLKTKRRLPR
jgi:glycosyltransferase involved in cell wall biosynthesis